MKRLFTLSAIAFSSIALAQDSLNVLYIGNSYIGTNDLPNIISQLAASAGKHINYTSHTPGGAQLIQHASNPVVLNYIKQGNWDYVVIQEQSQKPAFGQNSVQNQVYPYAKQLSDSVKYYNSCANVVFFNTWGYRNGDAQNCPYMPYICTYEGMDSALASRYTYMVEQNAAALSPVGPLWRNIRTQHPNIELYTSDNSHPSYSGSYAAALSFYSVFFNESPSNLSFNGNLNAATAGILRNMATTHVFDSLNYWNRFVANGSSLPDTFSMNITSPNTVDFSHAAGPNTTALWDFGDGSAPVQTTNANITHTYSQGGNYTVCLKLVSQCNTVMICDTLSINATSIKSLSINELQVFPNPAQTSLHLESLKGSYSVEIINVLGQRCIQLQQFSGSKIDISQLPQGGYTIKLQHGAEVLTTKFMKL